VCVALAFTCGARLELGAGLVGLGALSLAMTGGDLSGGFVSDVVFTVPAFVAGRALRSRNAIAAQLAARARELEQERKAYTREAVRYERVRIARDLHDIVAHSVSMIVVQAGAGRRALDSDPAIAAESLRHIEAGAQQAGAEIEQLVGLLAEDPARSRGRAAQMLDELVRQAAATGLAITYRVGGADRALPAEISDVVYRVAQEGITNVLKHAPGAAIAVDLSTRRGAIAITVENGPAVAPGPGLERAGGGYGLAGLQDRVFDAGGTLCAGSTSAGGWRLAAQLPL
jgi:signal transduction histidine kinase